MFKALMICAIFGLAVAVSPPHHPVPHPAEHHSAGHSDDVHADVLSRKDDIRADGFDSTLETSNHITRSDHGDEHGNAHGSFGWISPEGEHIDITYVADEHGYQASGAAVPAIPDYIVRSLAWNAAHPNAPELHNHHH